MRGDDAPPLLLDDAPPSVPGGGLSAHWNLLCVDHWEPSWSGLTRQLADAGCSEPQFRWVATAADALAALRGQAFDGVLIVGGDGHGSSPHEDGSLALLEALRAGGHTEPVVLVAPQLDEVAWSRAAGWDAEILIAARPWHSPALGAVVRRAVLQGELRRANRRLAADRHRRLLRERDEAERLLSQQRQIVGELERLAGDETDSVPPPEHSAPRELQGPNIPAELRDAYRDLLRAYVMLGPGQLAADVGRLAERLLEADLWPRDILPLHLEHVEPLIRGLGHRSTRHVLARADRLALELMMRFAELCRHRTATP